MRARDGSTRLFGLGGNDRLFGSAGNEVLVGGSGDDILSGGDGNDVLIGTSYPSGTSGQTDQLWGGSGADIFVLDRSSFAIVHDFQRAEGDKMRLSGTGSDYSLEISGSSTWITARNTDGSTQAIGQVNATNLSFAQDFTFV